MLTVKGRLICATEADADALAPAVDEHVRLTRAEPGCLSFDIRRDPDDRCAFRVDEAFHDRAAFEAHQARMAATDWPDLSRDAARDLTIAE